MQWYDAILIGIAGSAFYNWGRWSQRRSDRKQIKNPKLYSWKCPIDSCGFKVEGTSDRTVMNMRLYHIDYHSEQMS